MITMRTFLVTYECFPFPKRFSRCIYSVVSILLLCDGYGYLERLQASNESVALCDARMLCQSI
jgi:hypothetical protein